MNFSYPFIMRPVGTTLLAIGLLLVGIIAYRFLPVASLPSVDLPTVRVSAQPARRGSGHHGGNRCGAVGAPARRHRGRHRDHVGLLARYHVDHRAVRADAEHRRRGARRAGRDQRLAGRPAERPALDTLVSQDQSGRIAGADPGADLEDDCAERHLRCGRHRGGAAHRASRRRRRRLGQRRRAAGDPCARQSRRGRGGRHFARTGAHRDRGRQRAKPDRRARRRRPVADRRHQRSAPSGGGVQDAGGQEPERQHRAALRYRHRGAEHAQQPLGRMVQSRPFRAADHHQAGRRQCHRDRRQHSRADSGDQALDPERHRDIDPLRPHRHDPRQRGGHAAHARRHHRAGDAGGVPVPAPHDTDRRGRHHGAAVARRHLRADVGGGLFDRQSVADGARGLGRLRGRRRDRDDRERVPQPGERSFAAARHDRRRAPDRLYGDLDQHFADRGFHPAAVHGRHRRAHVP